MAKTASNVSEHPTSEHGWKDRQEYRHADYPIPEIRLLGWSRFAESVMKGLVGHRHRGAFEICYIERGTLTWWVEDEIIEVGPGDIYITWPDELHGGVDGVMHTAELYWCIFEFPRDPAALGLSEAESCALLAAFNALSHRRFPGHPGIALHYRRMLDALESPGPLTSLVVRTSLHLLLLDVLDAFEQSRRAGAGQRRYADRVTATIDLLHRHISDTPSIEDLASAVGLRPSYFREEFKNETGFSPVEFLTRLRVREARRLLAESDAPITEIAFRLGFNSSQYFATTFRKQTGMTPRDFRRQAALSATK